MQTIRALLAAAAMLAGCHYAPSIHHSPSDEILPHRLGLPSRATRRPATNMQSSKVEPMRVAPLGTELEWLTSKKDGLVWEDAHQRILEVRSFGVPTRYGQNDLPSLFAWLDAHVGRRIPGVQTIVGYQLGERRLAIFSEPAFGISIESLFYREQFATVRARWASLWRQLAQIAVAFGPAAGAAASPLSSVFYEKVLLGTDGRIVLTNLEAGPCFRYLSPTKTVTGRLQTVALSPGSLRGNPTERDAVFALGVALYFFATGVDPYGSPSGKQTNVFSVVNPTLPTPPSTFAVVPTGFDALVLRALAPNPDERFDDPMAFLEAADAVFDGRSLVPLNQQEASTGFTPKSGFDWYPDPDAGPRAESLRMLPPPLCWAWPELASSDADRLVRLHKMFNATTR